MLHSGTKHSLRTSIEPVFIETKSPERLVKISLYMLCFQMLFEEILPATVFRLILKSVLTFKNHAFLYLHSYNWKGALTEPQSSISRSPLHFKKHNWDNFEILQNNIILPTQVRKSVFMIYMNMRMCMYVDMYMTFTVRLAH